MLQVHVRGSLLVKFKWILQKYPALCCYTVQEIN